MRDLSHTEAALLDTLIEACGIESVLMGLSEACGLRAERIAKYDAHRAKAWATMEGALGVLVPQARKAEG